MFLKNNQLTLLVSLSCFLVSNAAWAQEEKAGQETTETVLAGGEFTLQAPKSWKKVEPRFNMIEAEFGIPVAGGDEDDADRKPGRLTIMAAGGSVDANIDRWVSQFSQPDGSSSEEQSSVEEIEVDGMKTHLVEISGTFAERSGGPVSPPTMRENYAMLAAIVETGGPSYFIKFYGDRKTVDANRKKFENFVKSMARKDG